MSIQEEENFIETLSDELASALGRAIWAFAKIEWLTYKYMKKLSKEDLDVLVDGLLFSKRIEIIKRLVNRIDGFKNEKVESIKCLNEVSKLADERNLIVHNPWQIWIDFEKQDFMSEIHKHSNSSKKLDLSQVNLFTEKTQKVTSDLQQAMQPLVNANDLFKQKK